MKLGNISQTIVQVPNFFYDTTKEVDAFKTVYRHLLRKKILKKKIYTKKILLTSNLDININHNPRFRNNLFDNINKNIYLPIYHKKAFTPVIKNKNNNIRYKNKTRYNFMKKYFDYEKKSNINETLTPRLREEIMNSTSNLLKRINSNIDLNVFSNIDSRNTMNNFLNKRYSIINSENQKSDKEVFRKILSLKINNLRTINPKVKENIKKIIYKRNCFLKKQEQKNNPEIKKHKLKSLLEKCDTNYLNLKSNNQENYSNNIKDNNFIDKNSFLTERINNHKNSLFHDTSKTRIEFNEFKKGMNISTKNIYKFKSISKKPFNREYIDN